MTRLRGIPVSPGVAWGPAVLLLRHPLALRYTVAADHVPRELHRLDRARDRSYEQLEAIRRRVAESAGRDLSQLFEAQMLMLDDRLLVPRARTLIAGDRVNAEWAVQRAYEELCAVFGTAGDEYLRERRGDIADVVGRLHGNLRGGPAPGRDWLADLGRPSILLADDLPPSIAGQLDRDRILGLAVDTGSRTHHSAILARSLGLPAIAGLGHATHLTAPGTLVLIDGTTGEFVIDPPAELIEAARARSQAPPAGGHPPPPRAAGPAVTADGIAIRIEANIELPSEGDAAREAGAQGIGLFRSEYVLGNRAVAAVDEEAQYVVYRDLVASMAPLPVTIRTFDVDEAQAAGPGASAAGETPAAGDAARGPLGMRALRLSLARRDTFVVQLRALVRAARHGQVRVLFPFVTSVDEVRAARAALREVQSDITARDGQTPSIPVGAMIEVPSAALTADLLADEVDFLSIGTNDLVQYCLAVDRADERMAGLYDPLHPAILRVVRMVLSAGRARNRAVAVCGEMAAEPAPLALLLGLGVTELSMAPASIPGARRLIQQITLAEVRRLARAALRQHTGREVAALVARALGHIGGMGQPGALREQGETRE